MHINYQHNLVTQESFPKANSIIHGEKGKKMEFLQNYYKGY